MDLSSLALPEWTSLAQPGGPFETMLAALVSAVTTLVLALLFLPRRAAAAPAVAGDGDAACTFLIDGSSLRPQGAAARALLDGLGGRGSRIQALARHLAADCPTIQSDLEALILYGESFRHHCPRADGSVIEIAGRPQGAAAQLTIRPASDEARARDDAERALARARAEVGFLRDVLDHAPVMAWTLGPDGTVGWANGAYRGRFDDPAVERADHRIPNAFAHVIEEVPLTARSGCESRRRVSISGAGDGDAHWFEVTQMGNVAGETVSYALDADALVAAESSLRRFVETLTETFAHLPIGLAVFDKNRRLGLFNPALSDLVKIDAVWLAGRPSLRDFLERLRETRQMPEQKDFTAFRRMLTELEEGARQGTYEENWVLPSGKIFRVTGRPHPQGALAFLFEDISATVLLERRYRSELELSQATLDRMAEAVAVFDTSGMLVFVNSAFEAMWGFDPMGGLEGPGIAEIAAIWEERAGPSPVWADLRSFATGAETRTSWTATVATEAGAYGGPVHVLVAPLPNGSTLVVFRNLAENRVLGAGEHGAPAEAAALRQAAFLGDLALGHLELPAEGALAGLAAAIAAAPRPEAAAGLTAAAHALRDGLERARELRRLAEEELAGRDSREAPAALLGRLERLLDGRGLALDLEGGAAMLATEAAGPSLAALPGMALAIAALAAPGSRVTLSLQESDCSLAVALAAAAARPGEAGPEPLALALARRRLAACGGTIEIQRDAGTVALAAHLPLRQRVLAAAEPLRLLTAAGG